MQGLCLTWSTWGSFGSEVPFPPHFPPHFPVFQGIYCHGWMGHEKTGGFCLGAVTNPSVINSLKTKAWSNELESASTLSLRWEVPEEMDHRNLEFFIMERLFQPWHSSSGGVPILEGFQICGCCSWGHGAVVALEGLGMVGLDFGGFSSLKMSRFCLAAACWDRSQ